MNPSIARKLQFVAGSLAGGVAIHVALVACGGGSGGGVGSIADSRNANASTFAQLDVDTKPCDTPVTSGPDGGTPVTIYYAIKEYPGLSKMDLAHRFSGCVLEPTTGTAAKTLGFDSELEVDESPLIADGRVAIACGSKPEGRTAIFRLAK